MRLSRARLLRRILFYLLITIILIYTLFPFYWAVVSSLKSGSALFEAHPLPIDPAWSNYTAVFQEQPFGRNILNSILVSTATVALSLLLAVTAAYAFGRISFRGRLPLLLTFLGVSMFPQVAVLSGMFELIRTLGLYNNLLGLVVSYMIITLPFTVWVSTIIMQEVQKEIEVAALVDVATNWQVFIHIILHLLGPALVRTGLLAFITGWNEFLFALTFTLTGEMRTVPVAIALISGASAYELPWGRIMAASVIVTVPLVLLVLVFQRKIVAGLTAGAVKG